MTYSMRRTTIAEFPGHEDVRRFRTRGDDPIVVVSQIGSGKSYLQSGVGERHWRVGNEVDRDRRSCVAATVPNAHVEVNVFRRILIADQRSVATRTPALTKRHHRRAGIVPRSGRNEQLLSIRVITAAHLRHESRQLGILLSIRKQRRPRQQFYLLPFERIVRLVLRDRKHLNPTKGAGVVRQKSYSIKWRTVVESPRELICTNDLDANRLVLGAKIAAVDRRRTQIIRARCSIRLDCQRRVWDQFKVAVQCTQRRERS